MLCLSNVCCPWTSLYQLSASSRTLLILLLPTVMWQLKNTSQLDCWSPTMHIGTGWSNGRGRSLVYKTYSSRHGHQGALPCTEHNCLDSADLGAKVNTLTMWNHSDSFENTFLR